VRLGETKACEAGLGSRPALLSISCPQGSELRSWSCRKSDSQPGLGSTNPLQHSAHNAWSTRPRLTGSGTWPLHLKTSALWFLAIRKKASRKFYEAREPGLESTPTRPLGAATSRPRAVAQVTEGRWQRRGAGLPASDAPGLGYKRGRLRRAGRNFPERSVGGGGAACGWAALCSAPFRSPAPARSPVSLRPPSVAACGLDPRQPGKAQPEAVGPAWAGTAGSLSRPRASEGCRECPAPCPPARLEEVQGPSQLASRLMLLAAYPRAPPPGPGGQRCARAEQGRGEGLREEPGGGCGLRFSWLSSLSLLRFDLPPPSAFSIRVGGRKEGSLNGRRRGARETQRASQLPGLRGESG
jgi:hypothetical protein